MDLTKNTLENRTKTAGNWGENKVDFFCLSVPSLKEERERLIK